MLKKIAIASAALFLTVLSISQMKTFYADEVPVTENAIDSRAAIIEWRYKVISNKLYKRQYNHSTKKWVGNWRLVA